MGNISLKNTTQKTQLQKYATRCCTQLHFFFQKFKQRTGESHPSLFGEGNATTSSGSEAKLAEDFGWWGSFYAIAQGRLTDFEKIEKLNFNACLTYLSFEKQKNEIEQKRIKHARQNRTH